MQPELLESDPQEDVSGLGRVALAPRGCRQEPSDFGGAVIGADELDVQRSDQLAIGIPDRRLNVVPGLLEAVVGAVTWSRDLAS